MFQSRKTKQFKQIEKRFQKKFKKFSFKQTVQLGIILIVCLSLMAIGELLSQPTSSTASAPVPAATPAAEVKDPVLQDLAAEDDEQERSAKQEQFCYQTNAELLEPALTKAIEKCLEMTQTSTIEDLDAALEFVGQP